MTQAEEVRGAVDIVKIVGDYVKLRKAGVNLVGLCPFHQEKTASFAVHPVKQIFHCFGCGAGGDVFKFVMLIENVPFPEALRRVAEKAGVKLKERPRDAASAAAAGERATLEKIHDVAARFFAAQLSATAEGRAARLYLADRGLSDETVARFRLGYAPSEGHALLRHLESAGFSPEVAEKSGLVLAEAEGRRRLDRFRRRIMFPIAREGGAVVAFGGRALGDDLPKYLNSPETPIYTKSRVLYHLDRAGAAIRKSDGAILVEGYMDAIAVSAAGFDHVVASCGTSLTATQVRLLARYTRRVVMNYDPDSAGLAATERSLELLLDEGLECHVLALPGGLDPDAFIRKSGAVAYGELLKMAPNYLDYLADRAAEKHEVRTPEGKIAAVNDVLRFVVRLPNPLLRDEWAERLADRLRLDDRLLREEVHHAASRAGGEVRAPRSTVAAMLDTSPAERELLRGCLEDPALADEVLPALVSEGALDGLASAAILRAIHEVRRRGELLEPAQLDGLLNPAELRLVYDCRFSSAEPLSRAAADRCVLALRKLRIERRRDEVQADLRLAEKDGDATRIADLLRTKLKVAGELAQIGRGRT
jgi:DNA primase